MKVEQNQKLIYDIIVIKISVNFIGRYNVKIVYYNCRFPFDGLKS